MRLTALRQHLPMHFFTIVLSGEPFIRYHFDRPRTLPCPAGSAKRCGATLKPRRVIAMRANSPFFPRLPVFLDFGRIEPFCELNRLSACAYAITRRPGSVYNVGNGLDSPRPLRDSREVWSQVAMFAASGGRRMRRVFVPWSRPCFMSGQGVCRKRGHRRKKGIPLPVGVRGPGGPSAKARSVATNELADPADRTNGRGFMKPMIRGIYWPHVHPCRSLLAEIRQSADRSGGIGGRLPWTARQNPRCEIHQRRPPRHDAARGGG
jgi:hypothetical protein